MGGNGGVDVQRQSQGSETFLSGDARRLARADAFQKRFHLKQQGLA